MVAQAAVQVRVLQYALALAAQTVMIIAEVNAKAAAILTVKTIAEVHVQMVAPALVLIVAQAAVKVGVQPIVDKDAL